MRSKLLLKSQYTLNYLSYYEIRFSTSDLGYLCTEGLEFTVNFTLRTISVLLQALMPAVVTNTGHSQKKKDLAQNIHTFIHIYIHIYIHIRMCMYTHTYKNKRNFCYFSFGSANCNQKIISINLGFLLFESIQYIFLKLLNRL